MGDVLRINYSVGLSDNVPYLVPKYVCMHVVLGRERITTMISGQQRPPAAAVERGKCRGMGAGSRNGGHQIKCPGRRRDEHFTGRCKRRCGRGCRCRCQLHAKQKEKSLKTR